MKSYKLISKKALPHSEIEVEIEIPFEEVKKDRAATIKELSETADIPGFRKGHVPENMIIERLGEGFILEKTSQKTLNRIFPTILHEESIEVISAPEITVTKLAPENPFEFKAKVAVMPEFKLPEYKKIAEKLHASKEDVSVTDKDVEDFIDSIRKSRAQSIAHAKKHTSEDSSDHSHDEVTDADVAAEMPALDDEFVKTLGAFESVDDLKKKVRENMEHDKQMRAQQKKRLEIVEAIIAETKIDVPHMLIENELDRMNDNLEADLKRMNLNAPDYYKTVGKTREQMREEWKPEAIKSATMNILLPKIAEAEKLQPDMARVEAEAGHLMQHYQGENVDPVKVKLYVYRILSNEIVFQFLENGGKLPATDQAK